LACVALADNLLGLGLGIGPDAILAGVGAAVFAGFTWCFALFVREIVLAIVRRTHGF